MLEDAKEWRAAMDQSEQSLTQPAPTTGILELAVAGYKVALAKSREYHYYNPCLQKAYETLTPEVRKMLEGW